MYFFGTVPRGDTQKYGSGGVSNGLYMQLAAARVLRSIVTVSGNSIADLRLEYVYSRSSP